MAPKWVVNAHLGYRFHLNGIVPANAVLDARSLAAVRMPNRGGFTHPDPRPDAPVP
jgi:cytochrome c